MYTCRDAKSKPVCVISRFDRNRRLSRWQMLHPYIVGRQTQADSVHRLMGTEKQYSRVGGFAFPSLQAVQFLIRYFLADSDIFSDTENLSTDSNAEGSIRFIFRPV